MTRKILIIDDDPEILIYLKELFQDGGFDTVTASNGVEGLDKVVVERPECLP